MYYSYLIRVCYLFGAVNTWRAPIAHSTNLLIPLHSSMPRTAVARRPGGDSGVTRKCYTVRQKLNILEECSRLQRELNLSAVKSATVAGISAATLRDWTSQLPELIERAKKESAKKSVDNGPAGQLDSIKDVLLMWMFGRRQQGVVVDVIHVVFKASSLLRTSFGLKSFEARFKAATRFVIRHDYVYRAKTNESTRAPEDVYAEATEFIALYRPSLSAVTVTSGGSLTWIKPRSIFRITSQRHWR